MPRRPAIPLTLALLAALLIFVLSTAPGPFKHALHIQGRLHPWLHLLSFALLAFLLLSAARAYLLRALLAVALLVFAYYTEARESQLDGWPIEQRDVRTDTEGILLGALLSLTLIPRRSHPASTNH